MRLHFCQAGTGDIILSKSVQKKFGKIWIALLNTSVKGWKEVQARDVSGASVVLPMVLNISGFLRLFKNMT